METQSTSWFDSFAEIANGYFQFRTAEAQADATGAGQAQLNNTVEQQTGTGQVPLGGSQLNGAGSLINGVDNKVLVFGGIGLLAAVLLIKR